MTTSTSSTPSTAFSPTALTAPSLPALTAPASLTTPQPTDGDMMRLESGSQVQGLPLAREPMEAHQVLQASLSSLIRAGDEQQATELIRQQPDSKIDTRLHESLDPRPKPAQDDKAVAKPDTGSVLQCSDKLKWIDLPPGCEPATREDLQGVHHIEYADPGSFVMTIELIGPSGVINHPGGQGLIFCGTTSYQAAPLSAAFASPPLDELRNDGVFVFHVQHFKLDVGRLYRAPDGAVVCPRLGVERDHADNVGRLSLEALSRMPYATPLNLHGETVYLIPPQPGRWPGMVEVFTLHENGKVLDMKPSDYWKHPDTEGMTHMFEHERAPLFYGRAANGELTRDDLEFLRGGDLLSINGLKVRLGGRDGSSLDVTTVVGSSRRFTVEWSPLLDIRCIGPGPLTWDRFATLETGTPLQLVTRNGKLADCTLLCAAWAAGQHPGLLDALEASDDFEIDDSIVVLVSSQMEFLEDYDVAGPFQDEASAVIRSPIEALRLPAESTGELPDTKDSVPGSKRKTPPTS